MEAVFGILLVLVFAAVTYIVASEGAFGAGVTFLCVLFSGLLAMNFFEPLANFLDSGISAMQSFSDLVALVGLFALFTFLMRLATDNLAPTELEFDVRVYQVGRWLLAAATGYVTMAFLLTAIHTAPLPREFLGFAPERKNLFDVDAPDRRWLGFTQHVSEKILGRGRIFDGSDGRSIPYVTTNDPETPRIWPNFPIRYASRRDDRAGGPTKKVGGTSVPSSLTRPADGAGGAGRPPQGGGAPASF